MRALDERELSQRSIVLFTADHGESLGEGDYWFAHGDRLDEALVRVPFLLRVPGLAPARRYDIAGLVDVFPTLVRLAAAAPAAADLPGRDLLATDARATDSVPYLATLGAGGPTRFGIVADGHKLVLTREDQGWQQELYRLGYEDENLVDSDPERARELRERLAKLRLDLRPRAPTLRQTLSEQDRQNLRALGYIEAPETTHSD